MVVMFEEQFASRDHGAVPNSCHRYAGACGRDNTFLPVAQRMTRAGEYVRAVVAQRHECAGGGTPVAGDRPPEYAAYSVELNLVPMEADTSGRKTSWMSLTISVGRTRRYGEGAAGSELVTTHEHHASAGRWTANAATAALDWVGVG
jgi:hypothetical protein